MYARLEGVKVCGVPRKQRSTDWSTWLLLKFGAKLKSKNNNPLDRSSRSFTATWLCHKPCLKDFFPRCVSYFNHLSFMTKWVYSLKPHNSVIWRVKRNKRCTWPSWISRKHDREGLWGVLRRRLTFGKVLIVIVMHGELNGYNIETNVRQGCIVSLWLFIDSVLRKTE